MESLKGEDPVVLGLARGEVPVEAEIAAALNAPRDVIAVGTLGVPFQPELAMGAIREDGARDLETHIISLDGITEQDVRSVERQEQTLLEARVHGYLPPTAAGGPALHGHTAVIVDDGMRAMAVGR